MTWQKLFVFTFKTEKVLDCLILFGNEFLMIDPLKKKNYHELFVVVKFVVKHLKAQVPHEASIKICLTFLKVTIT